MAVKKPTADIRGAFETTHTNRQRDVPLRGKLLMKKECGLEIRSLIERGHFTPRFDQPISQIFLVNLNDFDELS
jgi:hypothetical protein